MHRQKQKWLVLAHCFNMDGRAASQTITDKIPFLMEKGIEPVVVSAPTGYRDKDFIHHQVFSPAPSGINFEMRKILENRFGRGVLSEFSKALVTILCLPFLILEKLFVNLDSHWSWFISAGIKSVFLIRKHRIRLIYSTAGPSSTHLAGYLLKRWFGLPWIAEIHDPLISETGKKQYQRYSFHKWLEKKIFNHASAVVYFTETACNNARKRTGVTGNSHVLRPGANPPEVTGIRYKRRSRIHFGHFGSLDKERNLSGFMMALSRLIEDAPHLKEKLVLDVYGTVLDPESKKAVRQLGLEDVVVEHGRLEHDPVTGKTGREQVFEKMHQSDVLLLIHGSERISEEYVPSKLYEYLLTQRPIAGITPPDSELASILKSTGHAAVDPGQENDLETCIRKYIDDWENGRIDGGGRDNNFTIEKTVEKLIHIASSLAI